MARDNDRVNIERRMAELTDAFQVARRENDMAKASWLLGRIVNLRHGRTSLREDNVAEKRYVDRRRLSEAIAV